MKQLGVALHNYHGNYKRFPSGIDYTYPYYYWSWMAETMPFYEQAQLWRTADNWAVASLARRLGGAALSTFWQEVADYE